jgi:hypothetical protein
VSVCMSWVQLLRIGDLLRCDSVLMSVSVCIEATVVLAMEPLNCVFMHCVCVCVCLYA